MAGARTGWIDNLRNLLTLLLVIFHSTIAVGAGRAEWGFIHLAVQPSAIGLPALNTLLVTTDSFFMDLFFLISGLLMPTSCDRRGLSGYLRARLLRIGLPLLALFPLNAFTWLMAAQVQGSPLPPGPQVGQIFSQFWLVGPGVGWFLLWLLGFDALYLLARRCGLDAGPLPQERQSPPPRGLRVLVALLAVVLLAVVLQALVVPGLHRLLPPGWGIVAIRVGQTPFYALAFLVGLRAARHHWLQQVTAAEVRPWLWPALGSVVVTYLILAASFIAGDSAGRMALVLHPLLHPLLHGLVMFGVGMNLIVLMRDRLGGAMPLQQELAADSYGVYLVHWWVVVLLTMPAAMFTPLLLGRWILLWPAAFLMSALVAAGLRRLPLLNRVL
jgi:hypothetical protein